MTERMLYRVEDAAELLGVSRATLYELLRVGVVESVAIGRSRRIPRQALEAYVMRLRGDHRNPKPAA